LTKESTEEYGKELFEEEQQEEILQPAQQHNFRRKTTSLKF